MQSIEFIRISCFPAVQKNFFIYHIRRFGSTLIIQGFSFSVALLEPQFIVLCYTFLSVIQSYWGSFDVVSCDSNEPLTIIHFMVVLFATWFWLSPFAEDMSTLSRL